MRVACLSLSPLDKDARVQRTANTLAAAGHDVLTIAPGPWPRDGLYRAGPLPALRGPTRQRLDLAAAQGLATLLPAAAHPLYWLPRSRRQMLRMALRFDPDLVICNDWNTLPVGAAVKIKTGAKLLYDSHEFATREHSQNWQWRLVSRAAVAAIERRHIRDADCVLTVSESIATALQSLYGLRAPPVVVRNLPNYEPVTYRPSGRTLTILFHGLVRPERGLEILIASMPDWRFDGRIVIRGYGSAGYQAWLGKQAEALGVRDRVGFEPPLPPRSLIAAAAAADIGYLALPRTSEQYEFALPNKLFEYVMAGLAICATPCRDIADLVGATGAGLLTDYAAEPLAAALNRLTPETLDRMRRSALDAARTLNWEHEQQRLLGAVAGLEAE